MTNVIKVSDKLKKVNESYTINKYDNGYMIEIGGRDHQDEWKTTKIICLTIQDIINLVLEVDSLPVND